MNNSYTGLDSNGQPLNSAFNWKKNKCKAASSLYGILSGIVADGTLNEIEVFFLQNRLENQDINSGDFVDIYEDIKRVLKDNIITPEEKEDLLCLLNDCIEYGPRPETSTGKINKFLGFLKGIAADDTINEDEITALRKEILNNRNHIDEWPFNLLDATIKDIFKDNVFSKSEAKELCDLIQNITGTKFTQYGDAIGGATALFDVPVSTFENKNVCPTGTFISGTRAAISRKIEALGANIQTNVTSQTNILIIGTLASRDWLYTSAGTKIEKAINLMRSGKDIIITNEKTALLSNTF